MQHKEILSVSATEHKPDNFFRSEETEKGYIKRHTTYTRFKSFFLYSVVSIYLHVCVKRIAVFFSLLCSCSKM